MKTEIAATKGTTSDSLATKLRKGVTNTVAGVAAGASALFASDIASVLPVDTYALHAAEEPQASSVKDEESSSDTAQDSGKKAEPLELVEANIKDRGVSNKPNAAELLDQLVQNKEVHREKINPAFQDPSYQANLAYIMEKLPIARDKGGLKGIDLDQVFALHPTAAHALVRSAYITYKSEPVLTPEVTKGILDSRTVTNFGQKSKPTRREVANFVNDFTNRFVLPGMRSNLTKEYERVGADYTAQRIAEGAMRGYILDYKPKYDDITLVISGEEPSNKVALKP